jgi:Cu-processing system permease protein
MNPVGVVASITFREAARKKILWTALVVGIGFVVVFGAGLYYQLTDLRNSNIAPFLRCQLLSATLMIGLHTVDLLAVLMTILTSLDTISGEIASGTI